MFAPYQGLLLDTVGASCSGRAADDGPEASQYTKDQRTCACAWEFVYCEHLGVYMDISLPSGAQTTRPKVIFIEELAVQIGKSANTIRTCSTNKKLQHLIPRPFKLPHSRRLCWYVRSLEAPEEAATTRISNWRFVSVIHADATYLQG